MVMFLIQRDGGVFCPRVVTRPLAAAEEVFAEIWAQFPGGVQGCLVPFDVAPELPKRFPL